ncbi:efflux RND transporter periplasmic adaptor subunit [Bacteroides sp.]|uniref:efflux RND transporter periplasmic adaptor subunit n=1 Tax=Bacteroides sp. TaxID=29523 RepID=UPI0023C7BC03|nr:efflux RND transporter periplasmic adaptor subunit [Bacteroides sp.]MDE5709796.1 efflux RND transporter periplasmic adaptor subunit [Bacteroides sp.]MDE6215114.1 efflux RND transporter periplasmic adaptor subunit [Bacteroides sp.]
MKTQNYRCLLCLAAALLAGCSDAGKDKEAEEGVATVLPSENNEVTVTVLKRGVFEHELVSNGKVTAGAMADLRFETAGVVAQIYVKNGDFVRKGQKLAELDKFRLKNKTAQAKDALEKAELELQDVLIGQGYPVGDVSKVPADIMRLARVKSGYDQSRSQYELAEYEEEHATLVAPFDGVVANLFSKPFNEASTSEAFCTVVGTQGMEVDFTVLESELPLIKNGDRVIVTPYSDAGAKQEGRITQINPLVDEKGMVKVKAAVGGKGKLFSGMNVRVNVHRSLEGQLVIPKSAVVLRSGKQVVFTLKDGKAQWNYVQTGLENADSYSMADDALKEGDTVIVTGNVNLAHEAPVKTIEN